MVADGAECFEDAECGSGLCNIAGFCGPLRGIGESCRDSLECDSSAYCAGGICRQRLRAGVACSGYDSCLAPTVCIDGVCTKLDLECRPAPVGARCALLNVCEAGAYCDALQSFTCQPLRRSGESCAMDGDCGPEHHCAFTGGGGTGFVCTPSSDVGEACDGEQRCRVGTYCDSATSACAGQSADGEPCETGRDEQCESDECNSDGICGGPSACLPHP